VGRLLHCSYFVGPGRGTMSVPVHRWSFVTTVSIDVFSSFSTNITKETRSFASLSDAGAGNKLGGMVRLWSRERDKQDVRILRDFATNCHELSG
jgi:hypothetical protein